MEFSNFNPEHYFQVILLDKTNIIIHRKQIEKNIFFSRQLPSNLVLINYDFSAVEKSQQNQPGGRPG